MKIEPLSKDMTRKVKILKALNSIDNPSLTELAKVTKIPRVSVQRQISDLRKNYKMKIVYIRLPSVSWEKGHYEIQHWGVFDKDVILSI